MAVKTALMLSSALFVAYTLHARFHIGGHRLDDFYLRWVTDTIALLAAALCMWRAVAVRGGRIAWALFSLGMASWGSGNIYYSIFLVDKHPVPIPSVADALFLGTYPPVFIGLALLTRSRIRAGRARAVARWVDRRPRGRLGLGGSGHRRRAPRLGARQLGSKGDESRLPLV
jgi:hypothetical protein